VLLQAKAFMSEEEYLSSYLALCHMNWSSVCEETEIKKD
jgi:hypothetical protein